MGSGDNAKKTRRTTHAQKKMTSKVDLQSASVNASSSNIRVHQNKVAPSGMIIKQQMQLLGKRSRKRRTSASSSINLERDKNPSWIRKNILMRECIRFTEAPPPEIKAPTWKHDDPKCFCGKLRSKHDERYRNNPDSKTKWKVETHTHTCSTNAYGVVEFKGAASSVEARKFVRVEQNTAPDRILHLLNNQWNLGTPKLLISVTGGARNFPLNSRLKDVFRKGLIKAAISTGAWIITGGTHAGVMKYVGEASRDYALASGTTGRTNVIVIGIASWGVLDQKENLINPQGCFPATYRMDAKKRKGPLLDPNHSHFILVDNGTEGEFGVEIKLRGKVEKAISEQRLTGNTNVSIPAVCIVVEGGPNTIATVNEAIINNTPAVIVAGSGRAANILAFAFQRALEVETRNKDGNLEKRTKITDTLKVKIATMLQQEFGEEDLELHLYRISSCLQKRHLITVYELDSVGGMDIDGAILHALLKANVGRVQDQLNLALVWNRVDVAKREIFSDDRLWKKGELDGAFRYALVNNQVNFVRLFLEHGISLSDFLTVKELTRLYNEINKIKPNSLLCDLLEKERKSCHKMFNLADVGHVIQALTMDTYKALYLSLGKNKDYKYILTDDELTKLNRPESDYDDDDDDDKCEADGDIEEGHVQDGMAQNANTVLVAGGLKQGAISRGIDFYKHFEDPMRELFLYAVLLNRNDMARLFWEESKESIAAALVASKMLKTMAKRAGKDTDLGKELDNHAASFEEMAIGVLNECYNEDEERTALILVRELQSWGNQTCLNLAISANNKNFIAHTGVQNLLTEIWMGKISNDNKYLVLWLCTFCPFLIPFVVRFREDESEDAVEEMTNPDGSVTSLRRKNMKAKQYQPSEQFENTGEGDIQCKQLGESLHMVTVQNGGGDSASEDEFKPQPQEVQMSVSQANLLGIGEDFYESTANVDIVDSGKELSWWQRFVLFYDSPTITFRHNVVAYLIFLGIFSYIVLANFHEKISDVEILLIFWVSTLFWEEFRQIAQGESNSWKVRFLDWISDYWNIADLATLVLFGIGIVLRFNPRTLGAARVLLAIDLGIFYIRILHIFSVFKNLGPKLIMIAKMMVDLMFFVCILFVFIVAYGVAAQAIMFPNTNRFTTILSGVLFRSYFQMYGELFLEDIFGNDCNATALEGSDDVCPEFSHVGIILLSFYMLLSNILLLNLLIAMFSYTFSAVQDNTDIYWKFQRYGLIKEYFSRPPLVPPFIIISHVYFLGRFLLQKCCRKCLNSKAGEMKQILPDNEVHQLVKWEVIKSDDYIAEEKRRFKDEINERVGHTKNRVEDLLQKIEKIFADPETGAPSKSLGLLGEQALESKLNRLEDQMERTNQAIDWIISSLEENHLGIKTGPPELKAIIPREEPEDLTMTEDERKVPVSIEELGIAIHVKARTSPYPNTAIRRFPVSDDKVPWETVFTSYKPISYTHASILAMPHYADVDLLSQSKRQRQVLNFNADDNDCRYDRRSYMGVYTLQDGLPLNPKGRTGVIGRGILGRFGPNHAADPVVTRWKRTQDGTKMEDGTGKNILEFVAVQRRDNHQWAIPGGMVEPGDMVSSTLKREFGEEALGELEKNEEEVKLIQASIEELFSNGDEVYRGYVDDPRNTDNAWMETVCMNFHDEEGSSVGKLPLQAGDDAQGVRWQRISSKIPLFASHTAMLKKVAELHDASY